MNKKYLAMVFAFLVIGMAFIPSIGTAQSSLSMDTTDIKFYDMNGNEISSATIGDVITVEITLHNTGNTPSEPTDVQLMILSGPQLHVFENIIVPANGVKKLTLAWDTGKNVGSSVYPVEEGTDSLLVTYYPTDYNAEETSTNSGHAFSSQIEFKAQSSESNNVWGIVGLLLIIGAFFFALTLVIIRRDKKRGQMGGQKKKGRGKDWI